MLCAKSPQAGKQETFTISEHMQLAAALRLAPTCGTPALPAWLATATAIAHLRFVHCGGPGQLQGQLHALRCQPPACNEKQKAEAAAYRAGRRRMARRACREMVAGVLPCTSAHERVSQKRQPAASKAILLQPPHPPTHPRQPSSARGQWSAPCRWQSAPPAGSGSRCRRGGGAGEQAPLMVTSWLSCSRRCLRARLQHSRPHLVSTAERKAALSSQPQPLPPEPLHHAARAVDQALAVADVADEHHLGPHLHPCKPAHEVEKHCMRTAAATTLHPSIPTMPSHSKYTFRSSVLRAGQAAASTSGDPPSCATNRRGSPASARSCCAFSASTSSLQEQKRIVMWEQP